MPPFLPRKRSTPPVSTRTVPAKRARLTDALDAEATNNVPSPKRTKTFSVGSESSSDSSLSDVDSDQFEDAIIPPRQPKGTGGLDEEDEGEDEDDDIEWEDAAPKEPAYESNLHTPMANGPIQITLRKDDTDVIDYGTSARANSGKKGPSKREKQVRIMTHQLHVQFLLWHNAIRNSWLGDKKVQDILVKQLPTQIVNEVIKWRRSSGLEAPESSKDNPAKGKKRRKKKEDLNRNERDWGQPSQRLETGKPDMSHGDPIFSLMKVLSAYWKKRFAITAPGLRKRGYGTKHVLKQEITSLRTHEHDPEKHGERVRNIDEFRNIAEKAEGSRDIGAQLFTALLRGLGIEARLVASLQPSGYGWTKVEQMVPRKPVRSPIADDFEDGSTAKMKSTRGSAQSKSAKSVSSGRQRSQIISLDTDAEDQESAGDDSGLENTNIKDDESVVDVTPSIPQQRRPKYDRDLLFPIYWTEVLSPITNKITPVSPLVLETPVANTPETLVLFEPKGARAEKGRQVMAYVVAYSSDRTAKDVTVRYLRKHVWPGKTKGFRFPVEKVPIYDTRGKIKRHEVYDWFKHILSPYARNDKKRTAADDIEDSIDLAPQQPEKKGEGEGADTLQSLKSSADFVLERFLRREEALLPNAVPVRMFASGKGDKYKEEPVYSRADVERCLTAESWHKEGRRPKLGETPMKMVPVRAVTLTRKREAEEHERQYGEKQMQGLYSWDQTEWIIPPPIEDGVIPKNAYGNMDCFVPSMVPKGAVHIPLKGTVRICKRLDIDFAEAVTGFEFGNKRAVPICTGVVVAKENERLVKDAWVEWNEEQKRKEETKMEKLVLDLWRKFVLGLRIRGRVQDMYGEDLDMAEHVATGSTREDAIAIDEEEDQTPEDVLQQEGDAECLGGGFLLPHEEEVAPMEDLIMDEQQASSQPNGSKKSDAEDRTLLSVYTKEKTTSRRDQRHVSATDEGSDSAGSNLEDENHDTEDDDDCPSVEADQPLKAIRSSETSKTRSRTGIEKTGRRVRIDDESVRHNSDRTDSSDTNSSYHEIQKQHDKDSDDDDDDDDDDDEWEEHAPRATRTRAAKRKSLLLVKSLTKTSDTTANKTKSTSQVRASVQPASRAGRRNAGYKTGVSSGGRSASTAETDRGRGRPRKKVSSKSGSSTTKPSARSGNGHSTSDTSPYFEQ